VTVTIIPFDITEYHQTARIGANETHLATQEGQDKYDELTGSESACQHKIEHPTRADTYTNTSMAHNNNDRDESYKPTQRSKSDVRVSSEERASPVDSSNMCRNIDRGCVMSSRVHENADKGAKDSSHVRALSVNYANRSTYMDPPTCHSYASQS
jgi:hypothetical protein